MYFDRETIEAEGDICSGLLTPKPPKGGVFTCIAQAL